MRRSIAGHVALLGCLVIAIVVGWLAIKDLPPSWPNGPTVPASAAPSIQPETHGTAPVGAALAAHPVRVQPIANDGWISLTKRVCGSSASWQQQKARNGGAAGLFIGRWYTIDCPGPAAAGTGAPSPSPGAPTSAVTTVVPASPAWVKPVATMTCLRPNGSREFGTWRGDHWHDGADLGAPSGVYRGDPVRAIHAGTIVAAGYSGSAGNRVRIDHGGGVQSQYNHLSGFARTSGHVEAGEVIGWVGISGNATAYHVHFVVRVGGTAVDPVRFMADHGVRIGCA